MQPLLLTLDERYLLTATLPDLQRGMALLGTSATAQPLLFGHGVVPPGRRPWPRVRGGSSWKLEVIPFRYDVNQIPYDYTVEVTNRFKGRSDRQNA